MIREVRKNSRLLSFSETTSTEQVLILSCLFSIGLTAFRMLYTGTWTFVFLLWNLFLAVIPYLISRRLSVTISVRLNWKTWLRLCTWLAFIPNSFYILTDLFHLDMNADIPLWYDLLLLFSFAWNGLLLGVASVRQVEKFLSGYFRPVHDLVFVFPVMFLNAFGVYIGRYLRFNSWDIITRPFQLVQDIAYMTIHPFRNRHDWCMVIAYSVFMTLIYYSLKKFRTSGIAS